MVAQKTFRQAIDLWRKRLDAQEIDEPMPISLEHRSISNQMRTRPTSINAFFLCAAEPSSSSVLRKDAAIKVVLWRRVLDLVRTHR